MKDDKYSSDPDKTLYEVYEEKYLVFTLKVQDVGTLKNSDIHDEQSIAVELKIMTNR